MLRLYPIVETKNRYFIVQDDDIECGVINNLQNIQLFSCNNCLSLSGYNLKKNRKDKKSEQIVIFQLAFALDKKVNKNNINSAKMHF